MSKLQNYAHLHAAITRYVPAGEQPELEKFLRAIMGAESNGDRWAKNKTGSSAKGIYQFIDSMWAAYGDGKSVYDPVAQCDAAVRLALDNKKHIKAGLHLNRDMTAGEYYIGHFAGWPKAIELLKAPENTPISTIFDKLAMQQNSKTTFRGKVFADFTAGDLRDWANAKMNANMTARLDYQKRHDAGQTTEEENKQETEERRRILKDFGWSKDAIEAFPVDSLLGKLFIVILSMFLDDAATGKEREEAGAKENPKARQSETASLQTPRKTVNAGTITRY